jgi:hypothetical protein
MPLWAKHMETGRNIWKHPSLWCKYDVFLYDSSLCKMAFGYFTQTHISKFFPSQLPLFSMSTY